MQPTVGVSIFHKLLVAAPFLVMASIGARARSTSSNFEFVACSAKQNAQINAYAPLVSATQAKIGSPLRTSRKIANTIAYRWIEGAKVGLLQPLQPCAFDDSTREGIKNEIVRANVAVAEVMNYSAEQNAEAHHYDQAAKDAMVAADVLEVTKFSDFASLTTCTMVQRRSLMIIKNVAKKLSPLVKYQVIHEVLAFRSNDDRLGQMAMNARQELLKYELRRGMDLVAIEQTEKEISKQQFQNIPNLSSVIALMKKGLKDSKDDYSPTLYTDVRLGFLSQMDTDKRIDEIVDAAKTTTL